MLNTGRKPDVAPYSLVAKVGDVATSHLSSPGFPKHHNEEKNNIGYLTHAIRLSSWSLILHLHPESRDTSYASMQSLPYHHLFTKSGSSLSSMCVGKIAVRLCSVKMLLILYHIKGF